MLTVKNILYVGNKLSHHGFTPGVIETLGRHLEKSGYRVYYAGTKKYEIPRLIQMLYKTLTIGRKVDYILIDTYSTSAFWYAYLSGRLAKLIGTKYIPILHGGDLPTRLVRSKRSCDKLFKNSYANVAVSGYLKHEFEKQGYKTVVIPNSIDISLYPFKKRDYPQAKLLWVRSFHNQYNPSLAVDVISELLNSDSETELCMVGPDLDGSGERFFEYAKLKGLDKRIKITGKLSQKDWISLSANYDIFINTTNVDNTPVSIVEALSLGMLIVSTNAGGLPYLLEDGHDALLVPVRDANAMAAAIRRLLSDRAMCQKLSFNARKKAERFTWETISAKWIDLLDKANMNKK